MSCCDPATYQSLCRLQRPRQLPSPRRWSAAQIFPPVPSALSVITCVCDYGASVGLPIYFQPVSASHNKVAESRGEAGWQRSPPGCLSSLQSLNRRGHIRSPMWHVRAAAQRGRSLVIVGGPALHAAPGVPVLAPARRALTLTPLWCPARGCLRHGDSVHVTGRGGIPAHHKGHELCQPWAAPTRRRSTRPRPRGRGRSPRSAVTEKKRKRKPRSAVRAVA